MATHPSPGRVAPGAVGVVHAASKSPKQIATRTINASRISFIGK